MSGYQVSQLQLVVILVLLSVVPLGFLAAARRKVIAPVVAFGVLVGALAATGFALGYLGSEGALTPAAQVLVNHLKDAPAGLVVVYVCVMQVRRYRAARNGDRLRRWFERAPHAIGAAFLAGLVPELVVGPPVLESEKALPASAVSFESIRYVVIAVYASFASWVFFGGIALAGLAVLPLHTLVWRWLRTLLPEERIAPLVERLSFQEVVLVGLIAGSLTLGLLCYSKRSRSSRFTERFLNFLDLVGDLTEELSNVPVSKEKLNLPYACMHEASGEEFLRLSPRDRRRIDNAFCAKVVFGRRTGEDGRSGRIGRERFLHLSKLYEDELKDPILVEGLGHLACGKDLPGTLRELLRPNDSGKEDGAAVVPPSGGLREAVALAVGTEDPATARDKAKSGAEWEQLVCVALADAGLLPDRAEEAVLEDPGVPKRVKNAYELARFKVRNRADGLGPLAEPSGKEQVGD